MAVIVTDWCDPCGRANALWTAYYKLLSGGNAQEISYRDGNVERMIRFNNTAVDLSALKDAAQLASDECNGVNVSARRYAISLGARRRSY
jgi:uncharacterized lipoprotein YehR (DUF1307 family)